MELKQLVTELLEAGGHGMQNDFFYSEVDPTHRYRSEHLDAFDEAGVTVEHLDRFGGEDMGTAYYSVYSFEKDDQKVYVKFDGWYASHVGSEFTEYRFVEAKQQTVTVYS